MKRYFTILLLLAVAVFAHVRGDDLKTLVLIIATDDKPAFRELQKIWECYMNSDPEHFEIYFIRANPDLETPFTIKKNEIVVKTEEGYVPGILVKSLLSIKAFENRLDEFDYVIRTNLSSFFPLENLKNYMNKLPRQRCYCGVSLFEIQEYGEPPQMERFPFISGANIILSRDLAKMLIQDEPEFEKYKSKMPDDVYIGLFFHKKNVPFISAQRWDYPTYAGWVATNGNVEDYAYHFRAKYSYNARTVQDPYADEILTLKSLLKKYYPNHCP